jgi:hypothetical protein
MIDGVPFFFLSGKHSSSRSLSGWANSSSSRSSISHQSRMEVGQPGRGSCGVDFELSEACISQPLMPQTSDFHRCSASPHQASELYNFRTERNSEAVAPQFERS